MSSLEQTFAIKAFRDSLSSAITYARTDRDAILASLRTGKKAPRGVEAKSWLNLVGAVRLTYATAQREDQTEVKVDLRAALAGEFSDSDLEHFLELLNQDDAIDAQSAELLGLHDAKAKDLGIESRDASTQTHGATGPTTASIWVLGNK